MPPSGRSVVHFASAAQLRRWLVRHHATATELRIGFWRKDSGRPGLTYSARASFEQKSVDFPPALARRFQAERAAWTFFSTQSPSYRRIATWWVVSAKREETQLRRLAALMADSAAGRRLAMRSPKAKSGDLTARPGLTLRAPSPR